MRTTDITLLVHRNNRGEWLRKFHYSEDITLNTSHWRYPATQQRCPCKSGPLCGRHTWRHHVRCRVILAKLLDRFARLRLHGSVRNTSFFIQSPGAEVFCKHAASTDFQVHLAKIYRNCVHEKFPHKEDIRWESSYLTHVGNALDISYESHGNQSDHGN